MRPDKKEPAYLQLYEKIRNDIVQGSYQMNEKLPGKRILAEQNGLSLVTVEHALDLLREEGYLQAKERSGFYVAYHAADFYPVKEEKGFHPVRRDTGNDEQFPLSLYVKIVRRVLSEQQERLQEKPEGQGCMELRMAIAHYLARSRGIHVEPGQIIIGSGAEYLYSLIVQLLGRDRIYAIEDPSYEPIRKMYRANGVRLDPLKMGRRGIRSQELQRTPASVLHITPYSSYPTGVTADAGKRREYIDWALSHHAFLVEDDYESEFTISSKPEDTLFSMEPDHTVLYLNTFTKTISPSLRVGYMILPKQTEDVYEKKAGFYSCTVSTLSQLVIAEMITSGAFERHINKVRRMRRRKAEE